MPFTRRSKSVRSPQHKSRNGKHRNKHPVSFPSPRCQQRRLFSSSLTLLEVLLPFTNYDWSQDKTQKLLCILIILRLPSSCFRYMQPLVVAADLIHLLRCSWRNCHNQHHRFRRLLHGSPVSSDIRNTSISIWRLWEATPIPHDESWRL